MIEIQHLQEKGLLKWLQHIPFVDLRALYQSASAIVFPSLEEGFGFPILEGFASKTPVITSNISALPEISGKAAYLVNPYDIDHIRHAMEQIITRSDLQKGLIEKGIQRAKLFTWDKCAKETIKVCEKII